MTAASFPCSRQLGTFGQLLALLAVSIYSYCLLNEYVEHSIFKGEYLHNYWNEASKSIKLQPSSEDSLLVFQHIPRTAGDAMRTHLFADTDIDSSHPWPGMFYKIYNSSYLLDSVLPIAVNPKTRLIKGYFSYRDLEILPRKKKIFIFLRHPVERVISLLDLVRIRKQEEPGEEEFIPLLGRDSFYICTFTHNSIVYQLGGHQHCPYRRVDDAATLARAKQSLENAAFVGFYETLNDDFWALKRTLFPSVSLAYYIPFAFWITTWLALPRLRVLKYAANFTAAERAKIESYMLLDLELYEWAKDRFRPNLVLYPSYFSFFMGEWQYTLTWALLLASVLALCHLRHRLLATARHMLLVCLARCKKPLDVE